MTDEKKDFNEQEQARVEQEQLKLAMATLRSFHEKNNIAYISINSNGIIDAVGNRYEIQFLLDTNSEAIKKQNVQLLEQRQSELRELEKKIQQSQVVAAPVTPAEPSVEVKNG